MINKTSEELRLLFQFLKRINVYMQLATVGNWMAMVRMLLEMYIVYIYNKRYERNNFYRICWLRMGRWKSV